MTNPALPDPESAVQPVLKRPWEAPTLVVIEIDALTARNPNPRDAPTAIGTTAS